MWAKYGCESRPASVASNTIPVDSGCELSRRACFRTGLQHRGGCCCSLLCTWIDSALGQRNTIPVFGITTRSVSKSTERTIQMVDLSQSGVLTVRNHVGMRDRWRWAGTRFPKVSVIYLITLRSHIFTLHKEGDSHAIFFPIGDYWSSH